MKGPVVRRTVKGKTLLTAGVAVLAATMTVAGCTSSGGEADSAGGTGTGKSSADAGAFPVTIKHHFGSTTITSQPKRVAAVGVNASDNLLALGVVPVTVPKIAWGGDKKGSTPWFESKLKQLGATMPKQFDNTDSIPFADIAASQPDLILATNSGLTKAQYEKLSKIAPVVAYPGKPWVTPWQKTLTMDGKAVGKLDLAKKLEKKAEATLAAAQKDYPKLQGKTFVFGALSATDLSQIPYYTPEDQRTKFLTEIGMKNAPVINKISKPGTFYGQISAERAASLKSDLFITYAEKKSDAKTFENDKLVGQIPAIKSGHMLAATDKTVALAATVPTPLSIPYAVKHFVPLVAKAAAGR